MPGAVVQSPDATVRLNGTVYESAHCLEFQSGVSNSRPILARIALQPTGVVDESLVTFSLLRQGLLKFFINKSVEIFIEGKLVHWGKVVGGDWSSAPRGEMLLLTSRVDDHLFGLPLASRDYYPYPYGGHIAEDLVFNPVIDGVVKGNAFKTKQRYQPIHIEMLEQLAPKFKAEKWNLSTALHYLIFHQAEVFKPNGTTPQTLYFRPPRLAELLFQIGIVPIQDIRIPMGTTLPNAITALVSPYGFEWATELTKRTHDYKFWKRGYGKQRQLQLQTHGQTLADSDNALAIDLTVDHSSKAANNLAIYGDFVHLESTWILERNWDQDKYPVPSANLSPKDFHKPTKKVKNAKWYSEPGIQQAYREFVYPVADHDVAYHRDDPQKPRSQKENMDLALDLLKVDSAGIDLKDTTKDALNAASITDRPFLPCLTLGNNGRPIGTVGGCVVEWTKNPDALPTPDGGPTPEEDWKVVSEGNPQLLKKRMGIYFEDDKVPAFLMQDVKIRITATMVLNFRLHSRPSASSSTLEDARFQIVDLTDKYKYRIIDPSSIHYDGVTNGDLESTAVDDRSAFLKVSDELIRSWHRSMVSGYVTLPGIDYDAHQFLGNSVVKVAGRDVSFKLQNNSAPDIVGFKVDVQNQTTTFFLDTPQHRPSMGASAQETTQLAIGKYGWIGPHSRFPMTPTQRFRAGLVTEQSGWLGDTMSGNEARFFARGEAEEGEFYEADGYRYRK